MVQLLIAINLLVSSRKKQICCRDIPSLKKYNNRSGLFMESLLRKKMIIRTISDAI